MSTTVVRSVSFESLGARSTSQRSVATELAAASTVAILFLHVSWRAVYVHFSSDEMMNIHWYWQPGAWKVLD